MSLEWIDTRIRKPAASGEYLAMTQKGRAAVLYWRGGEKQRWAHSTAVNGDVIAWMPIPKCEVAKWQRLK